MSIRSETRQTGLLSGRPRLSPWSTSREYKDHVKDLCCMSEEFSRIVILDTNPLSFTVKPLNGIPCVPSSGELYQVYTFLLLPDWCALKIYHDLSGSVAMWLYIGYLFLFEDDDHMSLP